MQTFKTIEISDPRFEFGGLRHITVNSPALTNRADITVFIPEGQADERGLPIILLLHGVYGSHWSWALNGGAHLSTQRLIDEGKIKPCILVMPSDGLWDNGSGYLPHTDQDFERWIAEDVPAVVRQVIPSATEQSLLFIAGLSMGGFGAIRIGASYAPRFKGISGHSSVARMTGMPLLMEKDILKQLTPPYDRFDLLPTLLTHRDQLPPIRFDCGTEDVMLNENRRLSSQLTKAQIPHHYEEFPGDHSWPYWEAHLEETLLFFNALF